MSYQYIIAEHVDHLGFITINRPKKLNALNKATIKELHDAFVKLDEDEYIRAIIVTGSGEKAIVAGADISEIADFDASHGKELDAKGQKQIFYLVA